MAVQRRTAAASKEKPLEQAEGEQTKADAAPDSSARGTAAAASAPSTSASAGAPSVHPRVALNIGLHSVLMIVLPLGLFFASYSGLLDPVYARTFGIPRENNKTTIGAVLAVLGVNVVIASFLITAFNEPVADAPLKRD